MLQSYSSDMSQLRIGTPGDIEVFDDSNSVTDDKHMHDNDSETVEDDECVHESMHEDSETIADDECVHESIFHAETEIDTQLDDRHGTDDLLVFEDDEQQTQVQSSEQRTRTESYHNIKYLCMQLSQALQTSPTPRSPLDEQLMMLLQEKIDHTP